jgi:hypothetical protein
MSIPSDPDQELLKASKDYAQQTSKLIQIFTEWAIQAILY